MIPLAGVLDPHWLAPLGVFFCLAVGAYDSTRARPTREGDEREYRLELPDRLPEARTRTGPRGSSPNLFRGLPGAINRSS